MRKLIVSTNVSLDGFADHTITTPDAELLDFFTEQLETIGAVLFGRVTYQLFESSWPHVPEDPNSTRDMLEFAHKINAMPKIVFSRTLQKADWNNTRLERGDLVEEASRLKQGDGKSLLVGGISVMQALTRASLIDEYWLLVHPVIVGQGRRLFAGLDNRLALRLVDTRTFRSGAVMLHYLLDRE